MKRIVPIVIIIILLFLIRGTILSIHSVVNNQHTLSNLQDQLNEKQKENVFLQERLKYVKDKQYVEEEAREELGLVKLGEHVVLLPPSQIEPKTRPYIIDTRPNWQKWWDLFN